MIIQAFLGKSRPATCQMSLINLPVFQHKLLILLCWWWSLLNDVYINRKCHFSKTADHWKQASLGLKADSDMNRNAI